MSSAVNLKKTRHEISTLLTALEAISGEISNPKSNRKAVSHILKMVIERMGKMLSTIDSKLPTAKKRRTKS